MSQEPLFPPPPIAHYYGDITRRLFLTTAALSAIAIPIWGDLLPYGRGFEIASIIVLVLLAGLTNPAGRAVAALNIIVAGLGVLFLEDAAITLYKIQPTALFIIREVGALLMIFALYTSVKTSRAMMLHLLGKRAPFEGR